MGFALVLKVLGEVDRGHAAGTDFPLDGVAVGEGVLEAVEKVRHCVLAPLVTHYNTIPGSRWLDGGGLCYVRNARSSYRGRSLDPRCPNEASQSLPIVVNVTLRRNRSVASSRAA